MKYWQNLDGMMDKEKEKIPQNAEFVIHVSRNWQLLEVICSQDILIILIVYTKTVTILCQ